VSVTGLGESAGSAAVFVLRLIISNPPRGRTGASLTSKWEHDLPRMQACITGNAHSQDFQHV